MVVVTNPGSNLSEHAASLMWLLIILNIVDVDFGKTIYSNGDTKVPAIPILYLSV